MEQRKSNYTLLMEKREGVGAEGTLYLGDEVRQGIRVEGIQLYLSDGEEEGCWSRGGY